MQFYECHCSIPGLKRLTTIYAPTKVRVGCGSTVPPSARHVQFRPEFPGELHSTDLPPSLLSLSISDWNTLPQPLPHSLRNLALLDKYDTHLPLLPLLTQLTLGNDFNKTLDYLPASMTHLAVGDNFDCKLDHLPSSLLSLSIGNTFNQPLDHLPISLKHLIIGGIGESDQFAFGKSLFNHRLDYLPPDISQVSLNLYYSYNFSLDHLPPNLVKVHSTIPIHHLPLW